MWYINLKSLPLWCYAAKGLELTQVTVMDPSLQVVCDTFVKPDEEVIDCNTRYALYKGFVFQIIEHSTCSLSFSLGTFTGVNFRA